MLATLHRMFVEGIAIDLSFDVFIALIKISESIWTYICVNALFYCLISWLYCSLNIFKFSIISGYSL